MSNNPDPAAQLQTDAASAKPVPGKSKRWRMLGGLALIVALIGGGYTVWYELIAKHYQSTDNAYVQGPIVLITPQLAGTTIEIAAQDTDFVKTDQLLVRLDPTDAQVALAQAEAQLALTVREARALYGNNETLAAQIRAREAEVARAESEVRRLQGDLSRRNRLARSGAVSEEELTHTRAQLDAATSAATAAEAAVAAAREQLNTSKLLTDNTTPAQHPSVERAAARMREAMLAVDRTEIRAPVDGHVVQRRVQLGQRVAAGTPLMAVIPLDRVWVDANFKESQLASMRIGQEVVLVADTYGKDVTFRGTIEGLGAGTGSAFALLPAQNATGNWIKVVQRIPVRIRLDRVELAEHPLRIGLSMHAKVMTDDTSGARLASAPRSARSEQLGATDNRTAAAADAAVQAIIARNLGDETVELPAPAAQIDKLSHR